MATLLNCAPTKTTCRCTCRSGLWHSKPDNFFVRISHVSGRSIAVDVHRVANVSVPYQFLLHSNWCTNRIKPSAMNVVKCVRTDVAWFHTHTMRVAIR